MDADLDNSIAITLRTMICYGMFIWDLKVESVFLDRIEGLMSWNISLPLLQIGLQIDS